MPNDVSEVALGPGAAVGPYRIAAEVAPGLFEGVDPASQRRVALRPLRRDSAAAERLRRAATFRHANVVPVLAVESHGDLSFAVSEFAGPSLADHLATRGRLPWREATRVAADAARGVAALHAAGFTHGAVSPEAVLRDAGGSVRVADFAHDLPPPHYAAPERHAGMAGDARSDVYSLGATYFALLTGHPPFARATTPAEVAHAHNHEPVPAVREGMPDLPLRCDTLIHRAMAKNPDDRHPSVAALLADLDALAAADVGAPPLPPIPPIKRPFPSWSELARLYGPTAIVVAGLAAASYMVFVRQPAAREAKAKAAQPQPLPSLVNSAGMTLVHVPGGESVGGDPLRGDAPVHRVVFSKSFWVGTREVTQREYQAVMGVNPSQFVGDAYPVEMVSWADAVEFCDKLSAREAERTAGRRYRLPTEAEWEHVCRAGTRTPYAFGEHLPGHAANTRAGGLGRTTAVGTYAPNAWGLYDTHGNVWEWCSDWYDVEGYKASGFDPTGPTTGQVRVVRGGSYNAGPDECRSGHRHDGFKPETKSPELGFRVVCVLENDKAPPAPAAP